MSIETDGVLESIHIRHFDAYTPIMCSPHQGRLSFMALVLKTTCVESLALAPHTPLHWTDAGRCQAWQRALHVMSNVLRASGFMFWSFQRIQYDYDRLPVPIAVRLSRAVKFLHANSGHHFFFKQLLVRRCCWCCGLSHFLATLPVGATSRWCDPKDWQLVMIHIDACSIKMWNW